MLGLVALLLSGASADSNSTASSTEAVAGTDFGAFDRDRALVFCFLELAISVISISVIIWWMLDGNSEEPFREQQFEDAADDAESGTEP
jgi:hypothetical protein